MTAKVSKTIWGCAALAPLLLVIAACGGSGPIAPSAAAEGEPATLPTTSTTSAPTTTTSTVPAPPPRVAVVGDSTATRLALGMDAWSTRTSSAVWVGDGSRMGCPMGRGGAIHTAADAIGPVNPLCDWSTTETTGLDGLVRPTYAALVAGWRPDLVVVSFGPWDASDRQIPGDPTWRSAGDPVYDDWLLAEMQALTDTLTAQGATALWLTQPPWEGATRHPPDELYAPAADPTRVVTINALMQRLAKSRPDTVRVIDLAGWIASTGEDARLRPDGAHLEPGTAVEVMDRFLGPELMAGWQQR